MLACGRLLALSGEGSCKAEEPAREELRVQSARCRSLLKSGITDFYLPGCVDTVRGGYYDSLAGGKFAPSGEKFLTYQSRQLWFFSTLAAESQGVARDKAMSAADKGADFLRNAFFDAKHGGYFSKVDDAGRPIDRRKHAYLNSFALYGLVAHYRASRDPRSLEAAKALFLVLEDKAYDRKNGGYVEFFTEDWRPITDPKENGYVGAIDTKTYNTHLHLLESFAELLRVWPDPRVRERLRELVRINMVTVRHPDHSCNIDGWRPDWRMIEQPRNLRASYGHDVECVWLTLDAAQTLGEPLPPYRTWASSLCGYALRHGYDPKHGGFFYAGPLGQPADDTKKEWWVQAEALVSMLRMYQLTGKREYYDRFRETLDFVEHHQMSALGGWWATRNADGSGSPTGSRASLWQDAYHGGRALILCAHLLDELAGK